MWDALGQGRIIKWDMGAECHTFLVPVLISIFNFQSVVNLYTLNSIKQFFLFFLFQEIYFTQIREPNRENLKHKILAEEHVNTF